MHVHAVYGVGVWGCGVCACACVVCVCVWCMCTVCVYVQWCVCVHACLTVRTSLSRGMGMEVRRQLQIEVPPSTLVLRQVSGFCCCSVYSRVVGPGAPRMLFCLHLPSHCRSAGITEMHSPSNLPGAENPNSGYQVCTRGDFTSSDASPARAF